MLDGSIPLTSTIPISPNTSLGNGSEFVFQQNIPLNMDLDEVLSISITIKNIGETTWTKAGGYKLGSQNPQDNSLWGINRIDLLDGDTIFPGEEKTFQFEITAPSIAGYNNLQWRMIQEGEEWFGAFTETKLVIVGGDDGEYFDDCDLKTDWNPSALSINNTNQIQGFGCLEYTGSATDEYKKTFSTPYNANGTGSGTVLQFWYYISDVSLLGNENQVEISSSGRADADEYSWSLTGLDDGWNFVQLNTSDAGKIGNPDLSAINWFRLYRFKTGSVTTRIDAIQLLGDNLSTTDFDINKSFSLYPNPAKTEVNIAFTIQKSSTVSITLVNIMGQVVSENINNQRLHLGQHTLQIPLNMLNSGIYFARININDTVFTKKILKK